MDEARRFLRYVTPGLVFITETLILLWIIEPDFTQDIILKGFKKDSSLGLVVATILGSGGVGYMFSVLHHWCHWRRKNGVIDHREFVNSLRARGIIELRDRNSGAIIDLYGKPPLTRFQTWSILTGLWHERMAGKNSIIKAADPRATSLTDLAHSVGTARVSAVAASLVAFLILWPNTTHCLDFWAVLRVVFGIILAVGFWCLCCNGYRKTGAATQRFVEQVLDDVLTEENMGGKGQPIVTYVNVVRS